MELSNQNISQSPSLRVSVPRETGEPKGVKRPLMAGVRLLLTRTLSNPTCTLGRLTSSDGMLDLVTKEGHIPEDRESYIMWCLQPKTYLLTVEYCSVIYKEKLLKAYWPVFNRVPWFPKAGFYTGTRYAANKGRIFLGTEQVDDYTITGDDDACRQIVQWSKAYYDTYHDTPFSLEILQSESSIQFSTLSEQAYRAQQQAEQEKTEQEALKAELGLT